MCVIRLLKYLATVVLALLVAAVASASANKLPDGVGIIGGALAYEHYPRSDDFVYKQRFRTQTPRYKILVIVPVTTTKYNAGIQQEIDAVVAPDFQVDYMNLSHGTTFIESRYAEFLDTDSIVTIARQAEQDGYNGIFITCFGEPGVSIVRELVNIPVVGGFLATSMAANVGSHKYSIVSVVDSVVPMLRELARQLGVEKNLTSVRQIGVPVADLGNITLVEKNLLAQSIAAIQHDGAQAIVLGCTGMVGVRQYVEEQIQAQLNLDNPVPVLAPNEHSIAYLQSMIRMGVSQSRLTFYPSQAAPGLSL